MTAGPWHYAQAERLLNDIRAGIADTADVSDYAMRAQAHATLALAAAVALKGGFADETESHLGRTYIAWWDAAGPGSEAAP